LKVPEKNYDDLAGLDVKGKIVVYLSGGPSSIPGPLKAHYSSGGERWKYLKAAGAVGVASIQNPKAMDIPWSRSRLSRFMPSMSLADPSLDEGQGLRLNVTINPERADKFFQGTGHTIAEILADADNDRPLPHFALPATLRAHVQLKKSDVESQNVAGLLAGTDPKLKNEYVVMTAHLDHVGVGEPINGDKIYNGAMDDASGIASILEVGRLLRESNVKLRRSVLFVAVTGEEKGLQGSRYFAAHPTVNEKSIVADVNLDMFLPLHSLHYLEVQGLGESTLGDDIRAVASAAGVQVQADKEPQRNLFIRSDQYSFIRHGIPALAFKFGYLPGSPEEKLHKDWLRDRYHAPSDDLNQPVDKTAAAQFNQIILTLLQRVANEANRPQWKADSFFRRFAGD
jgi:Zn-dependent M28 family amino/carboxypeptidase